MRIVKPVKHDRYKSYIVQKTKLERIAEIDYIDFTFNKQSPGIAHSIYFDFIFLIGAIDYRLDHLVFIQRGGVRLPLALPMLRSTIG